MRSWSLMQMPIVLAVLAALGWGASDYFGGRASRGGVSVFVVVAAAESLGVVVLVPALVIRRTPPPADPRLLLAALAGVAVTVELSLIYRALARGDAFVTAPTGALGCAIAVALGLVSGDPLRPVVVVGLVCAVGGAGISAWTPAAEGGETRRRTDAVICLAAATAVATALTGLHVSGQVDPYWATAVEHVSTGGSAAIGAVITGKGSLRDRLPHRTALPLVALVAAVGAGGDLAYTAAGRGPLSIVSAISSLYPVTTIALARVLQRRRATRIQSAGIVLALAGAALLGAVT